jgi:hypothetical protein
MQGLSCRILPDQRGPVASGVELHADVYLPEQQGRYPAMIMFGGYSTELMTAGIPMGSNEIGSPPVFTARLTFSCNEIDSYVLARSSRIDTDGKGHQLSIGAVRPTACTEDPARHSHTTNSRDAHRPALASSRRRALGPQPFRLLRQDSVTSIAQPRPEHPRWQHRAAVAAGSPGLLARWAGRVSL